MGLASPNGKLVGNGQAQASGIACSCKLPQWFNHQLTMKTNFSNCTACMWLEPTDGNGVSKLLTSLVKWNQPLPSAGLDLALSLSAVRPKADQTFKSSVAREHRQWTAEPSRQFDLFAQSLILDVSKADSGSKLRKQILAVNARFRRPFDDSNHNPFSCVRLASEKAPPMKYLVMNEFS